MENYILVKNDELYHFGILGMKWGIRRYQNEDGSLTDAGRKHRDKLLTKLKENDKSDADSRRKFANAAYLDPVITEFTKDYNKRTGKYLNEQRYKINSADIDIREGAARYAKQQTGVSSPLDALLSGKTDKIEECIRAGEKFTAQRYIDKNYMELVNDYIDNSKKYDKELREFISQYLGEEGAKESMDEMAISIDLKNNKVNKQTLSDKVANNVYRDEGGDLRFGSSPKISYTKTTPKDYKSPNNGKYDDKFIDAIKGTKIAKDNNTLAIDREYELYNYNPELYYERRAKYLE